MLRRRAAWKIISADEPGFAVLYSVANLLCSRENNVWKAARATFSFTVEEANRYEIGMNAREVLSTVGNNDLHFVQTSIVTSLGIFIC